MSTDQERFTSLAPLILRVVVGAIFVAHGSQKLFGAFGGHGWHATTEMFEKMGFAPGVFWGTLVGGTEFFGGLGLLVGLFTRLAALGLAISMAVAVLKVHLPHGLFAQNGGFEYPLSLLAVNVALLIRGAGPISLDAVRKKGK